MMKYVQYNNNNTDVRIVDEKLDEVRQGLKFMFESSMEIIDDNDPRLKNSFMYCSKSRYDSIDTMNFNELREEFLREFDWTLEMIEED